MDVCIYQCKYEKINSKTFSITTRSLCIHLSSMGTISGGRFAGLNIHSFTPMKFSGEYFCSALASSVYYLTIAQYSWENFRGTLKNCENGGSLAQWIFPFNGISDFWHQFLHNYIYKYNIICMLGCLVGCADFHHWYCQLVYQFI